MGLHQGKKQRCTRPHPHGFSGSLGEAAPLCEVISRKKDVPWHLSKIQPSFEVAQTLSAIVSLQ